MERQIIDFYPIGAIAIANDLVGHWKGEKWRTKERSLNMGRFLIRLIGVIYLLEKLDQTWNHNLFQSLKKIGSELDWGRLGVWFKLFKFTVFGFGVECSFLLSAFYFSFVSTFWHFWVSLNFCSLLYIISKITV